MSIFTKIRDAFVRLGTSIETELSPFEHQFLHDFHPFARQVEHVGGQIVIDTVKTAFSAALAGLESGGNIGVAISAAAGTALTTLEGEGKPAVKNAVYGLLAILAADMSHAN